MSELTEFKIENLNERLTRIEENVSDMHDFMIESKKLVKIGKSALLGLFGLGAAQIDPLREFIVKLLGADMIESAQ